MEQKLGRELSPNETCDHIDENFKNIKTKINQHSEFQTNFLFLGGGITSLFLANILKYHLKDNVNIIIFDNTYILDILLN